MPEEKFMRRVLELAVQGEGWTSPNPIVGAVLVKDGQIIGEGFHEKFGEPHAEVQAIVSAGKNTRGATLYVNLEPCSSYGNTPPCTDAIIKAGIIKVVYGSSDPTQNGSSKILSDAGIDVRGKVLKDEADFLNRQFLYFIEKKLPYITVKFAVSLDGKLATKTYDSKWITNEGARRYARSLRAKHQAILVGSNTVVRDNPHLGTRSKSLKDPVRIILDTELKTPADSQVYRDSNVIVFTGNKTPKDKIQRFREKNINVQTFNTKKINIEQVLQYLAKQKIISVLVEGGGEVIGSFIDNKAVNEVYGFYAPILVGGGQARSISGTGAEKIKDGLKIKNPRFKKFGDNFLIHGLV